MNINDNILLIGGDNRQEYLYKQLKADGYNISALDVPGITISYDMDEFLDSDSKLSNYNVILLPIPYSKNKHTINSVSDSIGIDYLLELLTPGTIIYGGSMDKVFKEKCHSKRVMVWDIIESDSFALYNSIATAEGAIAEAIIHSPHNLHKSNVLVLGYGRCGSTLAKKLVSLGCYVDVCARRNVQKALAYEDGCNSFSFDKLENKIKTYDFIFNTIPAKILNKELLAQVKSDVTIIDISSSPGGTDFDICKNLGINAYLCLGLPGKYSPATSAKIICNCIKT